MVHVFDLWFCHGFYTLHSDPTTGTYLLLPNGATLPYPHGPSAGGHVTYHENDSAQIWPVLVLSPLLTCPVPHPVLSQLY